jgi:hypothetical protein
MSALTKEGLLSRKPRIEAVAVPELGEGAEAYLREMNAMAVLEYGALHSEASGGGKHAVPASKQPALMSFLLERTMCDEEGQPLFSEGELAKAEIPWAVAQRLWQKAAELNQLTETADSPKKSSEATPSSTLHAA